MNTLSKGLAGLALVLAAVMPLQAEPVKVIRIAVATVGSGNKPVAGGAYSHTVHLKGLLEDEFRKDGVKIEWSFFKGAGPAVNEALTNRQADFALQGDLPAVAARAGGLRTKLLLAYDKGTPTYLAVPPDSPAKTLEDLKGKKVAIFKGTNLQLVQIRVYAERGLSERDFRTINMDKATAEAALASKDIEGGWFGPEVFQLVDKGVARVVFSTKNQPAWLTRQAHVLVTEDFEKEQPQIVQRVVNTFLKEAAWESDEKNREQTLQLWARSGIPYAAYKEDFDGAPLAVRGNPLIDEFFINHYKVVADLSLKNRLIRKPIDVDSWVETKYLKQGLKDLKLVGFWPERDARGAVKAGR